MIIFCCTTFLMLLFFIIDSTSEEQDNLPSLQNLKFSIEVGTNIITSDLVW